MYNSKGNRNIIYEDDIFRVYEIIDINGTKKNLCFSKLTGRPVPCSSISSLSEKLLEKKFPENKISNLSNFLVIDTSSPKYKQINSKLGPLKVSFLLLFMKQPQEKTNFLDDKNKKIISLLKDNIPEKELNLSSIFNSEVYKKIGSPSVLLLVEKNTGENINKVFPYKKEISFIDITNNKEALKEHLKNSVENLTKKGNYIFLERRTHFLSPF